MQRMHWWLGACKITCTVYTLRIHAQATTTGILNYQVCHGFSGPLEFARFTLDPQEVQFHPLFYWRGDMLHLSTTQLARSGEHLSAQYTVPGPNFKLEA
jgi:hypothetical protein